MNVIGRFVFAVFALALVSCSTPSGPTRFHLYSGDEALEAVCAAEGGAYYARYYGDDGSSWPHTCCTVIDHSPRWDTGACEGAECRSVAIRFAETETCGGTR